MFSPVMPAPGQPKLQGRPPGDAVPTELPVVIEREEGRARLILICEHASNHIPPPLNALGLSPDDLARHIAWDPGALGVARHLSHRLDAPLVYATVSRLVIDCNREPSAPDSVPEIGEATPIPGNQHLSPDARARRILNIYDPFHRAIDHLIASRASDGAPALVSIHTFTPVFKGVIRPWHAGILFDRDEHLALRLLAELGAEKDLIVGKNQPYGPKDRVYHTLDLHAQRRGLPNAMIEIRNDLVASPAMQAVWGARLAKAIDIAIKDTMAE